MRKISFCLIISILIIFVTFPVFANQTIISDNPAGDEIEEIDYPEKMINNYGTVILINDSGNIENNYGSVTTTYGTVSNNYGAVGTIYPNGSVSINNGTIEENNYYVNVNNTLGVIKINNYRVQMNQYGLIETNNSDVWSNYGRISLNNSIGYVDDNYGTIENNKGTVLRNKYISDSTIQNIVNNIESGTVLENYANVTGGTIEKNYSKDVRNTTIYNNFSSEVGENVTIKKNFAEPMANTTIENQYYKLTVNGNVDLICRIDTNGDVEDNIYIDSEGQTWIRAEDAMFEVKAQKGYEIVDISTVTTYGNTVVSKEDARNIGFSNISGEIFIEVETREIPTFKVVFDANGGEFSDRSEILTYEKWLPDDYENLEKPVRDGYEFFGYFTEKDGGTNFDNYYNESGVDQDMTLYAHWKETSSQGTDTGLPESSIHPGESTESTIEPQQGTAVEVPKTNNPQTGNSIIVWLLTLLIATIGLIITRKK